MSQLPIALVSGASGGIGTAISRRLALAGYRVVGICWHADDEVLTAWNAALEDRGRMLRCDICDPAATAALLGELISNEGCPAALVNCAGITRDAPFHRMTLEAWREVLETNLLSLFNVTHPIYCAMRERRSGRIVNIGSINGQKGQAGQANYAASKAGLHGFTMSLAQEGARSGVLVNTIAPGYTHTPMVAAIRPDVLEGIVNSVPLKRLALPDEIASCVEFLLSEGASYITGAELAVNGGLFMD